MKGEIWNPGEPVKREDLDNAHNSAREALRERTLDQFTTGILIDSQAGVETRAFEITPDGGLTIKVGTGTAIAPNDDAAYPQDIDASDPLSTGGERLFIPIADTTAGPGNAYSNSPGAGPGTGTGTGAYKETADGLGGWTSTPQSTKTRSIPLVNGSMNRVWIRYMATIDTSVTSLHKVTGKVLFPRERDGYEIVINQSGTAPGSDTRYLLLGTVDLTTSPGLVTTGLISHVGQVFAATHPFRVSFRYDPSALAPTTAPVDGSDYSLETFLNARGTGIVTPTNILGLTLTDLGFTQDIDLLNHRRKHHASGLVVPNTASTSSALYPQTTTSTVVGGSAGTVFMRQLIQPDETLVVGGSVFSTLLPQVPGNIGPMLTGDAYVPFSTSDTAGIYGIIVKIVGATIEVEKRLSPYVFTPEVEFLVATVEWSGTAFINPSPTGVQADGRLFGTVANRNMQKDSIATLNIIDQAVSNNKLSTDSVSTAKIVDLNVTTAKLANDAVTTLKILDSNVTTSKLADDSVVSAKLPDADGTTGQNTATGLGVKTGHVQDDAIISQKLAEWDGVSTAGQSNTGSGVATAHIKDGAVTTAKLDAGVAATIAAGQSPIGSITAFAGVAAPAGWLVCDGTAVSRITYSTLFGIISTVWGVGDGSTTFNLPDLRGRFARGRDGGAGNDPDAATRTALHTGGNTGDAVGSYQADSLRDHTHLIWGVGSAHGGGPNSIYFGINSAYTNASGGVSTTPNAETRPKNAYVMYIIRY